MHVDSTDIEQRRAALMRTTQGWLTELRADGRERLSPADQAQYHAAVTELRQLDAEIERRAQVNNTIGDLSQRIRAAQETAATTPSTPRRPMINDRNLTYRRSDGRRDENRPSWLRDLVLHQVGMDDSGECRRRLMTHAREVNEDPAYMEFRDLSRVDGQGGYGVPPAWLMDQYVELARPGRAFANLCSRLPLPGGTDSINIPKVLTGTAVGVQTADNTAIADVDLTDTFISAPVRTIAGQQGVSIQLIDQSPIAFDEVIFQDLIAAHAAVTDTQVMSGTGTNGQVLGVDLTPGITTISVSTVDVPGIYSAIANAIQLIHTTRFMPPEVIVMHPRRWGWLLAQLDPQGRPLFLPTPQGPFNAGGILTDVASQQVVGNTQGLPIVTDPNVTTTAGAESPAGDEDVIYVGRFSDLRLWETGIRSRVLPETKASNLTVLCQIFSYVSFSAGRYPQSIVQIGGLRPPTF